jgi:hypothetical protein
MGLIAVCTLISLIVTEITIELRTCIFRTSPPLREMKGLVPVLMSRMVKPVN